MEIRRHPAKLQTEDEGSTLGKSGGVESNRLPFFIFFVVRVVFIV
jgi:hypothetical protein